MSKFRSEFPLLNAINDLQDDVRHAVDLVHRVAGHMDALGLSKAAEDLYAAVESLEERVADVQRQQTLDVERQISHGKWMMGGLLAAVVNGNLVPTPSEGEVS